MEVASPSEPSANGVAVATFPSVDPAQVVEHLASVCEVVLGATKADLEAPGSLLHASRHTDTIQRCTRFATDTQTTLYIQKDNIPSSTAQPGEETSYTYSLTTEISSALTTVSNLILMKRPQPIDPSIPLTSQITQIGRAHV